MGRINYFFLFKQILDFVSRVSFSAGKANRESGIAVNLYDLFRRVACFMMQPVYILRDYAVELSGFFKLDKGIMGRIWKCVTDDRIGGSAPFPVPAAGGFIFQKILVIYRLVFFPYTSGTPEIGNTRFGAYSGAGKSDNSPGTFD
jgi:hypothetical protein